MDIMEAMRVRHSVRSYTGKPIKGEVLAPTAINQQKFLLTLRGDKVSAKAGLGLFGKADLGIVKYHFELGSGKDRTVWL